MPKIIEKNGVHNRIAEVTSLSITAPNFKSVVFRIIGTSPYVQQKFSEKSRQMMKEAQEAGSVGKKAKKRDPKDFKACYENAQYKPANETWPNGAIPATQFKAAMVAACRTTDMHMTLGRQVVFVEPDGFDGSDMIPLVRITKGKPKYFEQALPNANGARDVRARPMWEPGWECLLRITYDADKYTAEDVANLLHRAGVQVGIGEGRANSRKCVGVGWGAFKIASKE